MSSNSSSSSSSRDAGVVQAPTPSTVVLVNVTVAPKDEPRDAKDTCTWYASSQCYMPRNCYDCINVALPKTECAVDPHGMCVTMSTYDMYVSMQSNASGADFGFSGYYPSANFTYCNAYDATCTSCKSSWREQYWSSGQAPLPAMCRGDSGCICISSCEMPNRVESIIVSVCSVFGFDSSKLTTVLYIGAAVIVMVIAAAYVFGAYAKRRENAERVRAVRLREERRERRRTAHINRMRTGPPLALDGWNSLRDKLLESEREFLEGGKPSLAEPGVAKPSDEQEDKSVDFAVLSSSDEGSDAEIGSRRV